MDDIKRQIEEVRQHCAELHDQIENLYNPNSQALKDYVSHTGFKHNELKVSNRKELQGHYGKVFDICWFENIPSDILSVSQDGKILAWDVMTGNKKLAIPMRSAWIMTCTVSPSGLLVASGGLDNLCTIHRIGGARGWENNQAHRELQQHEGYLSQCEFIDDGHIVTCSGDATCVLWDIENRVAQQTFTDHNGDVMSVSVNRANTVFVSGAVDATAKVWDPRTGPKRVANFPGHESDINDVEWFPDYNAFASGSDDSSCRLFDLRARQPINQYISQRIFCGVTGLDFTKSGNYLIASYDDTPYCAVWESASAAYKEPLPHAERVSSVMVSCDGYAIATGSWDFNIHIWA